MDQVKIVPDRIPSEINYRIIVLCSVASVAFHYIMTVFGTISDNEKNASYVIEIVFILSPLVSSIFAFVIAGFYRMSKTFGRSYILLGFGYLCSVIAELIYAIQNDILNVDPYPSIADPFYAGLNIFLITHIITNTTFFAKTVESESGHSRSYVEIRSLILYILIFCSIVFSYIVLSLFNVNFEPNFEFFYGLLFVMLAGITLPFLVYAVLLFKHSMLGKAWYVLLLSFIILIAGDVWYYYLEIFDQYNLFHPVNTLWISAYWLQTYALFKHKKLT
jgi:magnesium-transporting ATPase (P-type)